MSRMIISTLPISSEYAAAMLDTRGTIHTNGRSPTLTLHMPQRDVAEALTELLGRWHAGHVPAREEPGEDVQRHHRLRPNVLAVLEDALPYMRSRNAEVAARIPRRHPHGLGEWIYSRSCK